MKHGCSRDLSFVSPWPNRCTVEQKKKTKKETRGRLPPRAQPDGKAKKEMQQPRWLLPSPPGDPSVRTRGSLTSAIGLKREEQEHTKLRIAGR